MKFTLAWLKDHLETDAPLEEITERLIAAQGVLHLAPLADDLVLIEAL